MPVAHVFPPTVMLARILTWLPVLITMEFGRIPQGFIFYEGLDSGGSRISFGTGFSDKCGRGGIETRVYGSVGANTMYFCWDTEMGVDR